LYTSNGHLFFFTAPVRRRFSLTRTTMEALLHYAWQHRFFLPEPMRTTDGLPLEIIDTGLHNHDAGPDFFNAKIKIDGQLWVGNVEIHDRSSDWYRHGHETDENYNNVVLHVVRMADCPVETASGRTLPQWEMAVPEKLTAQFQALCTDPHYPACRETIGNIEPFAQKSWLGALTVERLEQKTERISHWLRETAGDWERTFFITLARRLGDRNSSMHAGIWDKSATGSHEVRGRTLGIVGYGNIGSQLSVLAEGLGMRVYFYDIVDRLALGNATRVYSLQELFERCETITLHVDGRASNAHMIGEKEFSQMRPRTLFLNLCRGNVVDVDALAAALRSGHIAGAAVDVFPGEPASKDEPFVSPLQGIPNVILTPHVGGSTQEAQVDIGRYVAGKLSDYEAYGNTSMAVNLPEVSVSAASAERILHLHRNVPGVLARLNHALASHNMNIGFQTLATSGEYGYVVTDVSGERYEGLVAELQDLEESIRVRMV